MPPPLQTMPERIKCFMRPSPLLAGLVSADLSLASGDAFDQHFVLPPILKKQFDLVPFSGSDDRHPEWRTNRESSFFKVVAFNNYSIDPPYLFHRARVAFSRIFTSLFSL
jgi:hypothetical protein